MAVLKCEGICKSYKKNEVLKNVNLTLEQGKIYGLIGRNGAGKTTLLSILTAQSPADSGTVTLDDMPVWENKEALQHICFSREINTVTALGPNNTKIKEYFKIAALYNPNWDQEFADKLIASFKLDVRKKVKQLSKGMLSMVTIIIGLASKADITILDEPVAGLDVVAREKFYKLLIEEQAESGRTFVISTHIIEEAADVFEEVIFLHDKDILLKDNTVELLDKCVHISGIKEDVEASIAGLNVVKRENIGKSMAATVILEADQSIKRSPEITIQPVSLQNLFIDLCGRED
ncbi:MAG: ABC transporter ATP-binding protein [Lachnospira sp.]